MAFLPLAGGEGEVSWDPLGESCLRGAIVNVLDIIPTPQEENPEYCESVNGGLELVWLP